MGTGGEAEREKVFPKKKKNARESKANLSLWFCSGPHLHSTKIALQAAPAPGFSFRGCESPSEPSQAVEEMKRLSREGQGREDGVGRRAATVRAAASSRWRALVAADAGLPGVR